MPNAPASPTCPAPDPENLAEGAYVQIREWIVSQHLKPGALLSENGLSAALGLSRTPIREALKRLEREYLVAILPKRGIVVSPIDYRAQIQILELRRGIEMRLIVRGTERATEAQRAFIADLADRMEDCVRNGDLAGYFRLDSLFDAEIDLAADNRFMTDAMRPVHALVRRFWTTQFGSAALLEALRQHVRMIRAASRGESDKVRELLTELYDYNERYLRSLLG